MPTNRKPVYEQISSARISKQKKAVISRCSTGGFTLAQQTEIADNGKIVPIFLRGSINIESIQHLTELRNAINVAIKTIEDEALAEWDEE